MKIQVILAHLNKTIQNSDFYDELNAPLYIWYDKTEIT